MQNIQIPNQLNLLMTLSNLTLSITAIVFGDTHPDYFIPCLILFAFLHLNNYALLHEATHSNLQSNKRLNYVLGVLSGFMFPTSFSIATLTHTKHHCCNRTDHEMFDYYYPNDSLFHKFGQWYSVLLGGFWPVAVFGNIIIFFYPSFPKSKFIQKVRSGQRMLEDMNSKDVIRIRSEILLIVGFWTLVIYVFNLSISTLIYFYVAAGFNWSTRQYITHAFSKRDVWEGAINLKTNLIHEIFLLNGNWDLEHHLHPELPWTYLKKSAENKKTDKTYFKQYLKMWTGPKKNFESSPKPISLKEYFDGYKRENHST
ncbi:fatty acid desaturase family protein [Leptospira meyeri]|uniref:fatty acid desaturase family protein n=1 Tax=Leptospira meyeri TaxID=29508 RepID=UPI001FED3A71|nr:fatty acid desaturase [Leptospira meyeri]